MREAEGGSNPSFPSFSLILSFTDRQEEEEEEGEKVQGNRKSRTHIDRGRRTAFRCGTKTREKKPSESLGKGWRHNFDLKLNFGPGALAGKGTFGRVEKKIVRAY